MLTANPPIETQESCKDPLKVFAESIFDNYSLSPDDRDEAIARYIMLADSNFPEEERIVENILYSMNCENVWLRNSSTNG